MNHSILQVGLGLLMIVVGLFPLAPLAAGQGAERIYRQFGTSLVTIETDAGSGSGFIVSRDGLIATKHHVVQSHGSVKVYFDSGSRPLTGRVIATDPRHDLALIKVDAGRPLTPVRLGSDRDKAIGAEIIAIGSPLGLEKTVSTGIISQIRVLDERPEMGPMIQITAPISPGSSGGALFSRTGQVIGVTTLQFRFGQNLNFAVPVERLRELMASSGTASRRGERRGGRPERDNRGETASSMEEEERIILQLFDEGLEIAGRSFGQSREGRIVRNARRALERGDDEKALRLFATYSRPVHNSDFFFFWGLIDLMRSNPILARRHLYEIGSASELSDLLEVLIEAVQTDL
jgi:hypothetical protein